MKRKKPQSLEKEKIDKNRPSEKTPTILKRGRGTQKQKR